MKNQKSKSEEEKENEQLKAQLAMLRAVALRVWAKFGCDENGEELDWSEWQDLKRECTRTNTLIGEPRGAYI